MSGLPNKVVHIVGGGSQNAFLNQLAANAYGLNVVAGPEEATAVGNAMVRAMALGVIRRLTEANTMIQAAFPIREFHPQEPETWQRAYARYRIMVG